MTVAEYPIPPALLEHCVESGACLWPVPSAAGHPLVNATIITHGTRSAEYLANVARWLAAETRWLRAHQAPDRG